MGVSGVGKSTIGRALATQLKFEFLDADWLHSAHNLAKMAAGRALDDDDRLPWLNAVGRRIQYIASLGRGSVTACSALKRSYRDTLRVYVPGAFFVFLDGPLELVRSRVEDRTDEVIPPSLLLSQISTLEALQSDERGVRVEVAQTLEEILMRIEDALGK
jgi:carbohydrate kinase (thermoresistant glucokinase family)